VNSRNLDVNDPTAPQLADAYLRQNAAFLSIPGDWLVLDKFAPDGMTDAPSKIPFAQAKPPVASPRGIRTMPTEIFQLVQYPSDLGRAAAFGVIVMAVTVLLTVLQRRYLDRRRFETVTGKGYRPRIVALRRGGRAGALALEIIYIGCAVVLPMIALLMVSLSSIWTGTLSYATLTLRNFEYVMFNYSLTQQAILNSLFLAVVGATLGVSMSVLQAYYINRSVGRRRALTDAILSLPLGIPARAFGVTIENGEGSTTPTLPIVLSGSPGA